MSAKKLDILYEDNHHLVVNKPGGLLVQGDRTKRTTLLEHAKDYLRETYRKPGKVYLGLVHRIDRPSSGVVLLARTSKAASRLSAQFRERTIRKTYWVLVEGTIDPASGRMEDHLLRRNYKSEVSTEGKKAALAYACLPFENASASEPLSFVEIQLETGRHHQIRVQFSHRGHPVLGDERYGATREFEPECIALHARTLVFKHIVSGEEVRVTAPAPKSFPALI